MVSTPFFASVNQPTSQPASEPAKIPHLSIILLSPAPPPSFISRHRLRQNLNPNRAPPFLPSSPTAVRYSFSRASRYSSGSTTAPSPHRFPRPPAPYPGAGELLGSAPLLD